MIINHNMNALNAHRNMSINNTASGKSMEKLSSGLRINRAGDDAAGLAISEKMRAQINGLDQAARNSQDGISLIQTAEGALNETHSILQRMRTLAVQSANDTNIKTDRNQIQAEMDELAKEITRISNDTEFNQQNLLGGNLDDTFQVGANSDQNINLKIGAMDAQSLGVAADKTTTSGTVEGNISKVSFQKDLGSKVVNGAEIEFKASEVSAEAAARASVNIDTVTVSAKNGGVAGNNYKVKVVNAVAGAESENSVAYDSGTKILTITIGYDNAGSAQKTLSATDLNRLLDQNNDTKNLFTASGTGDVAVTDETNMAGGKDAVQAGTKLTISSGSDDDDKQEIMLTDAEKNATKYTVTEGKFKGLSIELGNNKKVGELASSDKVTVSSTITAAKAASFDDDGKMTKAVTEAGIDVSTQTAADKSIKTINNAIETVSSERSKLGAYQNRLEHTINNLNTSSENLTSAESRVRDVDMAKEMMTYSKNNILQQAAQAMLAQANQTPQNVLQLLR